MIAIGFAIKKNELWYSVVDGNNKNDASIVFLGKHSFQSAEDEPTLMRTFYNLFNEIINQYRPDRIACKCSLNANLKQLPYMNYSIGILALLCNEKALPLCIRSTSWFGAKKQQKESSCIAHFSSERLSNEKLQSTIIAWYEMGD